MKYIEMYNRWKKWLYTPPDDNDSFGVHIREAFQLIFKCNHKWTHDEYYVHGESHGIDKYKRRCKWCSKRQYMVSCRIGQLRWDWKNYPDVRRFL